MEATMKPQRDWTGIMLTLGIQILGMAWYFGSLNARMSALEHINAVAESRGGYATHDDVKDLTANQSIQDQQRDMRMNAIDAKVDGVMAQVGSTTEPYRRR